MTNEELEYWQAVTASSEGKWVEDYIYRLNGRGAFFYKGGVDGIYIEAQSDGLLTVGRYEGAIPHIGDAIFSIKLEQKYDSYNEAFENMCKLGGRQLMADMFSPPKIIIPQNTAEPKMEF